MASAEAALLGRGGSGGRATFRPRWAPAPGPALPPPPLVCLCLLFLPCSPPSFPRGDLQRILWFHLSTKGTENTAPKSPCGWRGFGAISWQGRGRTGASQLGVPGRPLSPRWVRTWRDPTHPPASGPRGHGLPLPTEEESGTTFWVMFSAGENEIGGNVT